MRKDQDRQSNQADAERNSPSVPNPIDPQSSEPSVSDPGPTVVKDKTEDTRVHQDPTQDPITQAQTKPADGISISDRLIILLTAILAGTGIISAWITHGQLEVMRGQLAEMRSSGADTKLLAESAKKQADNTERLANAALEQVRHLEVSAKEIHALAATSQDALDLARINFIKEQRPYVWGTLAGNLELRPGEHVRWGFIYGNHGKSPAMNVRARAQIVFGEHREERIDPNLFKPIHTQDQPPIGTVIFPGDASTYITASSREILTEDDITYIMKTDFGFKLVVYIKYFNLSGARYSTEICRARLQSGAIANCNEHNKIN
jgi:hypothetical protein